MSFSAFDVSKTIAAQFTGCQDSRLPDTPLHSAAYEGDIDRLQKFLSNGKRSRDAVDQRNHLGCTPLRLAATEGHADCVERLLNHGASVDITDVKGQTPLHVAVKNAHYRCTQLLLKSGADPNGSGRNRATPLCVAAMEGRLDFVQLLLAYNADVIVRRTGASGLQFTVDPLQMAIAYQHFDCLRLLLAAGGQPLYHSSYVGATSPYHTVVSLKCSWRFAQLLYEFGMRLWVQDSRNLYPWQMEPRTGGVDDSHQELVSFLDRLRSEPRPLRSACRLSVWTHVASLKKNVSCLKCLPGVPHSVIQYLTFEII